MENYAKRLAINHKVSKKSNKKFFPIKKLKEVFKYIGETYDILNESISKNVPIPPSGEWILDNYYLIEEQVNVLKKELSLSKYKSLPSVNGVSRIYLVAKELVKFTDANITQESLETFIKAYQTKKSIYMDELWVLPIMIKICLIEFIKELCEKIKSAQIQKFKVESLVERIIKNKPSHEQRFYKYRNIILDSELTSYVEYLIYCLNKFGKEKTVFVKILEEEVQKIGTTTNDIIKVEHYDLALKRVLMSNSITSIRNISRFNFMDIFEKINPIENILQKDYYYSKQDFNTRNMYREEIKKLARKTNTSEVYIATKLIEIAGEKEHIGFYLFGNKRKEFYNTIEYKNVVEKQTLKKRTMEYIFVIYFLSTILAVLLTKKVFVFAIIPMSEIIICLTNRILTRIIKPKLLPRIEKIDDDVNTFIIVPTLLTSGDKVKEIMNNLERHYLANRIKNVYFALLGDASETNSEKMEYDDEIINTGIKEAERLNKKYGEEIFSFLYRKRIFNKSQGKWLGYERKRGMISEFNKFLLEGNEGTFIVNTISKKIISKNFKYVITLDADTQLIFDSAKKLIGIMEHPLNQPIINNGIVNEGYGLIQPKVGISLESSISSIFSKIYAGYSGLDMYSLSESNLYQDVFGEAIFNGKGIYNLKVFEEVLKNQIPENTVLSHDLLEGSYVRVGYASDVEVQDTFPSRVNSYMIRQQRWTRGDWQILKWLFSKRLNILSKYKIFDNLRRSLVDISTLGLFFCGFYLLPIFVKFFPFILDVIDSLIQKIYQLFSIDKDDIKIKNKNYLPIISGVKGSLYRCTLELIFLPYQAILFLEAILITLYRMFVSKKNLLEWLTADDAEKALGKKLICFIKEMMISPLVGFLLIESSLLYNSISIEQATALFIVWFSTPFISYIISLNYIRPHNKRKYKF